MYRALVFDIGNTLVKTVDLIESAYLERELSSTARA